MHLVTWVLKYEDVEATRMDATKNKMSEPFPKVQCPGCFIPMTLMDLQPIMFTSQRYRGSYRCERCGTETKREFKYGRGAKAG
jgi:hypothetical protein